MPKKFGLNEKQRSKNYFNRKQEAIERQENKKVQAYQQKIQAQEDAYWHDDDKVKAKKEERKQLEEQKKEQVIKNKLEKQALIAEEEKELAKASQKKPLNSKKAKQYDAQQAQKQALLKSLAKMAGTTQSQEQQEGIIEEIKETSDADRMKEVNNKIEGLNLNGDVVEKEEINTKDRNPERRAKDLFMDFEEKRLVELKKDYPTLKLSQLREKIWKEWKKHPDNPFNQQ